MRREKERKKTKTTLTIFFQPAIAAFTGTEDQSKQSEALGLKWRGRNRQGPSRVKSKDLGSSVKDSASRAIGMVSFD